MKFISDLDFVIWICFESLNFDIWTYNCYYLTMTTQNSNDKPASLKDRKLHLAIVKQMITLSTSGFGLVAALAWNNVIQEFVNNYIKKYLDVGSGTISLLVYAILITILAVTITYQLGKLAEKLEK